MYVIIDLSEGIKKASILPKVAALDEELAPAFFNTYL
jgi:hypothetical protein